MHIQLNYLRKIRKRSKLSLEDIALLMNQANYSNLSRFEKGNRPPSIAFLLVYHLLFSVPLDKFFELHIEEMRPVLFRRIQVLLDNLRSSEPNSNQRTRIEFLEGALTRLTPQQTHE